MDSSLDACTESGVVYYNYNSSYFITYPTLPKDLTVVSVQAPLSCFHAEWWRTLFFMGGRWWRRGGYEGQAWHERRFLGFSSLRGSLAKLPPSSFWQPYLSCLVKPIHLAQNCHKYSRGLYIALIPSSVLRLGSSTRVHYSTSTASLLSPLPACLYMILIKKIQTCTK